MDREQFIKMMSDAKLYDLTQGCSIFTPPWPGEKSLEIHFFKRVTGAYGGGQGANGQILNWSNTVGTHLVGERAFHSGARAIADIPLTDLNGPGVIADISDLVSDYSIYTPEMITSKVDVKPGDISDCQHRIPPLFLGPTGCGQSRCSGRGRISRNLVSWCGTPVHRWISTNGRWI